MPVWGDQNSSDWVSISRISDKESTLVVCQNGILSHVSTIPKELEDTIIASFECVANVFWKSGRSFGAREQQIKNCQETNDG